MPFGGTTSADDFESGTIAAAHGGTTSIVDFAIQYKGQTLRQALGSLDEEGGGQGRDRLRLPHDHHRPARSGRGGDGRDGRPRAITSFKLFMAYRGVFMLDDGSIFRALLRTAKNGGTICMHAENGDVIDVLVQQALARGARPRRSTTR